MTSASSIRLLAMALPSRAGVAEHAVQALLQVAAHGLSQMRIDLCRINAGVPEQHLHRADIDAAFEEMGGEALAQAMDLDLLGHSGALPRAVERQVQRVAGGGGRATRAGGKTERDFLGLPGSAPSHGQRYL